MPMLEVPPLLDVVVKHSGLGADDEVLEAAAVLECQPGSVVVFLGCGRPATMEANVADPSDPFHMHSRATTQFSLMTGEPAVRDQCLRFGAQAYYSIYNGLDPETHYPVSPEPSCGAMWPFSATAYPIGRHGRLNYFLRAAKLAPKTIPPGVGKVGG